MSHFDSRVAQASRRQTGATICDLPALPHESHVAKILLQCFELGGGYSLKLIIILALICVPATIKAQDSSLFVPVILEQEPSPGNNISSLKPKIRIRFDDSAKQIQKEKLLFEVDRNDVSAFVEFIDGSLVYTPSSDLAIGQHEVRITGTIADGKQMQEVLWTFTTQEAPRNFTFGIEPSGTLEYKVRREDPNTDRYRSNSSIAIHNQSTGRFQTSFNTNLQGQSPTPGSTPKDFDMANYLAVIAYGNTSFSLGDVLVNYDLLGVANLSRRGILFQQKLPFRSSGFDVFSVRSESIIGFVHGFGFSDPNQRVDGGSFFISPNGKPENLNLRFYYLRGENENDQGFNFGGVTRGSKGDAFGIYLTNANFANQFRIEANAGLSNFDFNAGDDFDGNKDHALQLKFIFDPAVKTWKNRSSKLFAELDVQDLGTFFKTLANPFLVGDRRGFNLNSTWTYGEVGFTGGVAKFHDNVKDLSLIPKVDNTAYSAGFNYTPVSATGLPNWPAFTLTATRSEQQSQGEAVSFLAVHNIIDTVASLVTLTRTKWSLNWNTSYSVNNDLNNRTPDSDTLNLTFASFFMPMPGYNLGPSISFIRQGNRDTNVDTNLWTYSFTASIPIQPERFALDTQMTYASADSTDNLNINSNFSGTAQFSYHLHNLLKTKGRQTIALRVSYNRLIVEAPFPSSQKGLEIFGLLDVGWPFGR